MQKAVVAAGRVLIDFITFIFSSFFLMAMALQKYMTTIVEVTSLNDYVKLFRLQFQKGTAFHFTAGQFVIITVIDIEGKPQRRSYSIASSPQHTEYIELCIKILPDGRVSGVLDKFAIGTHLEIDGPYGKFTVDKEEKKELIFVGAGVGIAPLRSMIHDLFEIGYNVPIWLFFGFRFDTDYIFRNEFTALEEKYSNFHFIPVVSRPSEKTDPDLDIGHVDAILPMYVKDNHHKAVFICGSLPMVKDVVKSVEALGMTKEQIKTDAWG